MLHKLAQFVLFVTLFTYGYGDVNICDGVANYVFLTDVTDCTNYYICVNNNPVLQSCLNDTYFDAATQSCVTTNTQCLNCPAGQLLVYPLQKTCNMYILCFDGTPVIQQCADDLQYDPTTNQCNFAKTVNCVTDQCSIYQNPSDIVYIPSYAACDTYYICFQGAPVAHTCATGLSFSTDCNCCSTNSTCSISKSISPSAIDFKTRSINRFTVSENTKPVHVDIDCPPQGVEYRPFEGRENQFFMCLNGKGALMTCAPNLYYDHTIQSCRDLEHIVSFDMED